MRQRIILNRSSVSGRFVSESYADRHPDITEREVRLAHPRPNDRTIILNRNAENGQFVTRAYLQRYPATTEREVRRASMTRTTRRG
jgi:hypothetical protein